jgi:hypothetical protein
LKIPINQNFGFVLGIIFGVSALALPFIHVHLPDDLESKIPGLANKKGAVVHHKHKTSTAADGSKAASSETESMPMLEDVRVEDAPVENYRVDGVGLDDMESPVHHDESKRYLTTKPESVAPSSILESAESMPLLEPAETEKQELEAVEEEDEIDLSEPVLLPVPELAKSREMMLKKTFIKFKHFERKSIFVQNINFSNTVDFH